MSALTSFRMSRSVVAVGLTLLIASTGASRPTAPGPDAPAAPPRLDFNGDPLPTGALARIGTVRFRHEAGVSAIEFSPDGGTVYSLCYGANRFVRAWAVVDGREVRRFGRENHVLAMAVSPDGGLLATAEDKNLVRLWNTTTGEEVRRIEVTLPEPAQVRGELQRLARWVHFGPNGKTLIAEYAQGETVIVWDTNTGKELRRWANEGSGRLLVSADGTRMAVAGASRVSLVDTATGRTTQTIALSSDPNNELQLITFALSPDGKTVVTSAADDSVRVWDAESAKELRKVGAAGAARAIAFSHDGGLLAIDAEDRDEGNTVGLFDPATGKEIRRLEGYVSGMYVLTFSPDGKSLATGGAGHTLRLWETATGKEVRASAGHTGAVTTIALSPDGKLAATCSVHDKAVRLWDTTTGAEVRKLDGHAAGVDEVQFSPDGKLLASAAWNQPVYIWEVATGRLRHRFEDHVALGPYMRFADDGNTLATGSRANTIALWDCTTGKLLRELAAPPHGLASLLTFHDGRLIAYENPETDEDNDPTIALWDVTANRLIRRFTGHAGRVNGVNLSADGRLLASRSSDRSIRVWEVVTGAARCQFREPGGLQQTGSWTGTQFLSFSADNRVLVTCASDDPFARRWDLTARRELPPLAGHRSWVGAVEFSANGRVLLTGSQDTTALAWASASIFPPAGAAVRRTETELAGLWEKLGGRNGGEAHVAVWALVTAGDQAAEFIGSRLSPAVPADDTLIARWIGELDHQQFALRERATASLVRVADQAEEALRAVLERTRSAEVRQRVRHIVESAHAVDLSPDRLRELRAVEVLETIATPAARDRLAALARGAAGAYLTREAQAALRRLGRWSA